MLLLRVLVMVLCVELLRQVGHTSADQIAAVDGSGDGAVAATVVTASSSEAYKR